MFWYLLSDISTENIDECTFVNNYPSHSNIINNYNKFIQIIQILSNLKSCLVILKLK